jgi:putative FmdB family regulatory protein
MPLYEYRCQCCAQKFERLERPSSPAPRECPKCGGTAERILGVPALQFKGAGWYVTDYGKGKTVGPSKAKKPEATAA